MLLIVYWKNMSELVVEVQRPVREQHTFIVAVGMVSDHFCSPVELTNRCLHISYDKAVEDNVLPIPLHNCVVHVALL